MPTNDLINKRKQLQESNADEDADFAVGSIRGLDVAERLASANSAITPKGVEDDMTNKKNKGNNDNKNKDINTTTTTITNETHVEENIDKIGWITKDVTDEMLKGTVELKLKPQYRKLAEFIANSPEKPTVQHKGTYFQINGAQINIKRSDAERVLGKLSSSQWRMLVMNRTGEVAELNEYNFILGAVEAEEEATRETAQINTRIDAQVKADMDVTRALLEMTQSLFLETAIKEYAEKIRSEIIS